MKYPHELHEYPIAEWKKFVYVFKYKGTPFWFSKASILVLND